MAAHLSALACPFGAARAASVEPAFVNLRKPMWEAEEGVALLALLQKRSAALCLAPFHPAPAPFVRCRRPGGRGSLRTRAASCAVKRHQVGGLFALQPLPMLSDCWRNKRLGIGFVEAVCDGEKRMQVGAQLSCFVHPLAHAREHLLPRGLCLLRELFKGSAFKRSCAGENLVLDHQGAADLADEGTPIRVIRRSARMSHAWGAMPLAKFAAAVLADKGAGCDSHAAERVCAAPRLELADCTGLRRVGALTPSGWL